jgi:flagellar hook-length control protein FliK
VSREGVSNPSGVYSQLNQRALRSSMIHQIVDKAELWLGRDQAQMVIDLKPDILGRVHLKISEEAGKVVAEIRAENASTKALIESGLPDLETALSEKGFSFDAITVSWASGRGSVGTGFDGNNMSWFSEPNSRGHNDNLRQPQGVTNTVGRDDTTSLARGFGMKAYLDYIV